MTIDIKEDGTQEFSVVDSNVIQPFSLEKSNVRGRMVRLGSTLTDIMQKHDYPAPVSALLSEMVTLCLMLSAMIKYDGVFSLQIKSEGAIKNLVADVTSDGAVRAYADFDKDTVEKEAKQKQDTDYHYYYLLGKGYMAFNVHSNIKTEKSYQGVVALQGKSILDDVEHYFDQSEQIKTSFKLAVHPQDSYWRAGGIMIQHMPSDAKGKTVEEDEILSENWNRTKMLLSTCKDGEILSPTLHSNTLLYRLFHEEDAKVYTPSMVYFACRCSQEKIESMVRSLPQDEVEDICKKDGKVSITCEFCSQEYNLSPEKIGEIYKESK